IIAMKGITEKTLQDLQFPTILETVASYCVTDGGREKALNITPIGNREQLDRALLSTSEYVWSLQDNNALPNHGLELLDGEHKLRAIEGCFHEPGGFRKLAALSDISNTLIQFLKKFQEYYTTLFEIASQVPYTGEIISNIDAIV